MKTAFLPRLAVAGLLTTLWVATSAYTTPTMGSFRPAEVPPVGEPTSTLEPGQHYPGPMNDAIGMLTIGPTSNGQVITIGTVPTRPGPVLGNYTSTDFTEFDQLAVMP